ncbi:MAG: hypothetical protein Q9181_007096 [Wetmoreana brouardii]
MGNIAYRIFFKVWLAVYLATTLTTAKPVAWTSSASVLQASPISGGTVLPSTTPNVSAVLPPAEFTIDASDGSVALGDKNCFLLTIKALITIAKLPFNARTRAQEHVYARAAPGMVLILSGPLDDGGFGVGYIVWGLTLAIRHMVDHAQFSNLRFTLRLRGQFVGTVWYRYMWNAASPSSIEGNQTSSISKSLIRNDLAMAQHIVNDDENTVIEFAIRGLPDGRMDLNEAMMVIVGGFTDVAVRDLDEQISARRYVSNFPPFRAIFELCPAPPPPAVASWFTWRIVYLALGQVAKWYLTHDEPRPVQVVMFLDRAYHGWGMLVPFSMNIAQIDGMGGGTE